MTIASWMSKYSFSLLFTWRWISYNVVVISCFWCYFTLFLWCNLRVMIFSNRTMNFSTSAIMHPHNNCWNTLWPNNKFNSVQHAFLCWAVKVVQLDFGRSDLLKGDCGKRGKGPLANRESRTTAVKRGSPAPRDLQYVHEGTTIMSDFGL